LAADIERHLNNEPVVACPPSNLYKFQKLVRRNKLAFASGGVVVLVLALGIIASTWQAVRATRAEKEQVLLRQRAEAAERQESQLRQKAEANERIVRANAANDEGQFEEVEKLLDEVPAASFQEDSAKARAQDILYDLANWEAGENRLSQADDHFALLVSLIADGGSGNMQTSSYEEYAAVLVEKDDVTHYEKLRDTTLKLYGDTPNSVAAERMLTGSLLLPVKAKQLPVLEKLAEVAARSDPGDKVFAPWAYTALALFEYRRGNFEQSVEWSRKAFSFGEFPARSPRTHLLLAMDLFQLKQVEQARAELVPVRKIMADKLTGKLGLGEWDVTGHWHDWIINRILFREAEALIGDQTNAPAVEVKAPAN
jgi:tetratricopeptide (TPR) repeat protein